MTGAIRTAVPELPWQSTKFMYCPGCDRRLKVFEHIDGKPVEPECPWCGDEPEELA